MFMEEIGWGPILTPHAGEVGMGVYREGFAALTYFPYFSRSLVHLHPHLDLEVKFTTLLSIWGEIYL